jgi:hypothetical protein
MDRSLRELNIPVYLTVWLRAAQCVKQDVQIANDWQNESVVDAETVGDEPL